MKRWCLALSLPVALAVLAVPIRAQDPPDRHGFDVVETTIEDVHKAVQTNKLTYQDLVQMYLDRIAAFDVDDSLCSPSVPFSQQRCGIHAYMHVSDSALDDAADRDANRAHGRERRPLWGVPIILKDNINTADMPTTAGSVALGASVPGGSIPPDDAFITKKLRDAGAIIMGKGTLTEYANFLTVGMPTGFNSQLRFQLFQQGGDLARVGYGFNPHDPRPDPRQAFNDGRPALQTGGSSSGPGIGVNANLATIGIGTETQGSILSPGSVNMLVGIKPTVGLVSRTGIVPITADQDIAGPLARTVTDAATLLGVIAGPDPDDPSTEACQTSGNCLNDYTQFLDSNALQGARIAVPKFGYWSLDKDHKVISLSAEQEQVLNNAIDVLGQLGADVRVFDLPDQDEINNFGTCVSTPAPLTCSTVLLFGFKRDLNNYLKALDPNFPIKTLADVIAFNNNFRINNIPVGLKYGQSIAIAANSLDTTGDCDHLETASNDTKRYCADRKKDLDLYKTRGLDAVFNAGFDAVLFPANFGAGVGAKAGYPSIVVPGGRVANPAVAKCLTEPPGPTHCNGTPPTPFPDGFNAKGAPFGVTLTGPAFSEGRLIGYAFAFEQATHNRVAPESTPPLPQP